MVEDHFDSASQWLLLMIGMLKLDLGRTSDHFDQLDRLHSPILLKVFDFIFDSHFCISEAILGLHYR